MKMFCLSVERTKKGLLKCLEEIKVGQKRLKEKVNQLLRINDDQNLSGELFISSEDKGRWLEDCGVKKKTVCFIAVVFIKFIFL